MIVLDSDRQSASPGAISRRRARRHHPGDARAPRAGVRRHVPPQQEFPLYFGETIINYLRYGDSEVIDQLRMMPFIAIGIVVAFLIVTLIGFQNIRRSEERYHLGRHGQGDGSPAGHAAVVAAGLARSSRQPEPRRLEPRRVREAGRQHGHQHEGRCQTARSGWPTGLARSAPLRRCAKPISTFSWPKCVQYYRAGSRSKGKGTKIEVSAGDIPPVPTQSRAVRLGAGESASRTAFRRSTRKRAGSPLQPV